MAETKEGPTFVVKLTGILSPEDIERYARKFEEQLPGRVIVTDGRVEDVNKVTDMQPRDAIVTVHHKRQRFDYMSSDGNTPVFRDYEEVEQVPAKVWPVAMSENEMLVEWEDGTLGKAKLWDIRMGVMKNANYGS
jgi:hypothetical protein